MHTFRMSDAALDDTLAHLWACCQSAERKRAGYITQSCCTVVATLIAAAGRFGGTEQANLMDRVTKIGFQPEFYGNTIRVRFTPGIDD